MKNKIDILLLILYNLFRDTSFDLDGLLGLVSYTKYRTSFYINLTVNR